jgi:dipeptidyl aminopeptidase/acylaminoacyl peptidase
MTEQVTVRSAHYNAGGAEVPARIYEGASKQAGVLLCPGRFRDIDGLEFLATGLVGRGCVVLATRYRGMDFFTDDADALSGLDLLQSLLPGPDPHLAVVGHSRGAMTALRLAAHDQRIASVVALAPPTDFDRYVRAMELLSPIRYQAMVGSMGGRPDELPERYRALSALSYADRIQVPVLLVCGNQDLHAPLDHSMWMLDALRQAGNTSAKLEVLEGVGHFFERMYSGYVFDEIQSLTSDWLESTLASKLP